MKILHPMDRAPIAYIGNNEIKFTKRGKSLETILESGITIPPRELENFGGKRVVYYKTSPEEFVKAFISIFYPGTLREQGFELIHSENFKN